MKPVYLAIRSTVAILMTAGIANIATTANAGTIRDDRNIDSHKLLAAEYPSVGRLLLNDKTELCSGTLVDPNWVLTAGHCIYTKESGQAKQATFQIGSKSYEADTATYYQNWDGVEATKGYDIGLLKLTSPVTNITPANLYKGSTEVGEVAAYTGFGRTGDGVTGATKSNTGTKLAGANVIDGYGSDFYSNWSNRVLISDFDSPSESTNLFGSPTPLDLEYSIAPGDSGGGVFIDGSLAGVNSFGSKDNNAKYGSFIGATRVSPYVSWINNAIAKNKPTSELVEPTSDNSQSEVSTNSTALFAQKTNVPESSNLFAVLSFGTILGWSCWKRQKAGGLPSASGGRRQKSVVRQAHQPVRSQKSEVRSQKEQPTM
jgi:secreted trypsin-like serine protease